MKSTAISKIPTALPVCVVCVWQLSDCLDYSAVPMDGGTLTAALHERGVNVRYLGTLLRELDKVEDTGRLDHIQVSATAVPTIKTYM